MKVIVQNNDFIKYETFLSHYDSWIENKRDIKLLFLLQPESTIEFKITFEYSNIYVYSKTAYAPIDNDQYHPLVSVKSIKFILKNNKIEHLEIETSDEYKISTDIHLRLNNTSLTFYVEN